MKADKTLSIQVKSKTERRIMEDPEIEMISEWNLKRIITVLIIFLILIFMFLAYYFSRLDDNEDAKNVVSSHAEKEPTVELPDSIKPAIPEQASAKDFSEDTLVEDTVELIPTQHTDQEEPEIALETVIEKQIPVEIPKPETLNQHVTQARLARWVKDKVPHGQVVLPLLVDDTKAEGFYYFTDVNNMQGNTVFHEWLREGESIYKRKFNIKGARGRMSTSKLFTYRTTGQWQVRLITEQGEMLHKIDFSVENK